MGIRFLISTIGSEAIAPTPKRAFPSFFCSRPALPLEGHIDLADTGTGPFFKLFYASTAGVPFVRPFPKVQALPRHS